MLITGYCLGAGRIFGKFTELQKYLLINDDDDGREGFKQ